MSILQNLNKKTNLTLEEALFIVCQCSTNVQQPNFKAPPHCTLHMKATKCYNIHIFPYFNDSLVSIGSKWATITNEQVHNTKAMGTKVTCFSKLLNNIKP
jgi:hypothetical protein